MYTNMTSYTTSNASHWRLVSRPVITSCSRKSSTVSATSQFRLCRPKRAPQARRSMPVAVLTGPAIQTPTCSIRFKHVQYPNNKSHPQSIPGLYPVSRRPKLMGQKQASPVSNPGPNPNHIDALNLQTDSTLINSVYVIVGEQSPAVELWCEHYWSLWPSSIAAAGCARRQWSPPSTASATSS